MIIKIIIVTIGLILIIIIIRLVELFAEQLSASKLAKYSELAISLIFVPIDMCSLLVLYVQKHSLSKLGRRMSVITGEMRKTTFLFQRLP